MFLYTDNSATKKKAKKIKKKQTYLIDKRKYLTYTIHAKRDEQKKTVGVAHLYENPF